MCPWSDYFNHDTKGVSSILRQTVGLTCHQCECIVSEAGYSIIADRDYGKFSLRIKTQVDNQAPGEEVVAHYGPHANDKLLIDCKYCIFMKHPTDH
jgi:hypothetical protein